MLPTSRDRNSTVVRFTASETVDIAVTDESVPIQHYLRQPQRLVWTIANPKLIEQIDPDHFSVKVRPIDFMGLYHFQPMSVLKVTADAAGTLSVKSEECAILGNDFINDRFTMTLRGKLAPKQVANRTHLCGWASLRVDVELPPALLLVPLPVIETTGNGLLKGVLQRIKQRLLAQLVADYQAWATGSQSGEGIRPSSLRAAESPSS